jgi:hypothetical protein
MGGKLRKLLENTVQTVHPLGWGASGRTGSGYTAGGARAFIAVDDNVN